MKINEYQSKNTFDETVENIKNLIPKIGFGVIFELPFNKVLKKSNYSINSKVTIIEVCKASIVKDVIDINTEIAYFLPCKIVVRKESNKVHAGLLSVKEQFVEKVSSDASKMADEIEKKLSNLIESACN